MWSEHFPTIPPFVFGFFYNRFPLKEIFQLLINILYLNIPFLCKQTPKNKKGLAGLHG